jgi:uncharacterized protein (TIGR02301 family)
LPVLVGIAGLAAGIASPKAAAPVPPIGPPVRAVPYDASLLRLAEIMGALHFLEQLCDGEGASEWREQMAALLGAEQPDDQRRARMVDQFNRGFEAYRSVYRACTDSARLTMLRYREEGGAIAAEISTRYGRGS